MSVNHEGLGRHLDVLVRGKARFLQFPERRLGNRTDAEDVRQPAFLRLVAHQGPLRDEEKLVPWFYQLLRNLLTDHYRHRDVMARLEQSVAAETEAVTDGEDGGCSRPSAPACMTCSLP